MRVYQFRHLGKIAWRSESAPERGAKYTFGPVGCQSSENSFLSRYMAQSPELCDSVHPSRLNLLANFADEKETQ